MKINYYTNHFFRAVLIVLAATIGLVPAKAQVTGWSSPASAPPYGLYQVGNATNSAIEAARAVCTDAAGNYYVLGTFGTGATFDPSGATNPNLTSNNLSGNTAADMYVAKYNANGVLQWAVRGGATNATDNGNGTTGGICTDGTNVYVAGTVIMSTTATPGGTTTFTPAAGTCTGCSVSFPSSGVLTQGFVAQLSASTGQWQWVDYWGTGTSASAGHSVCEDPSGNVYVTGQINGTAPNSAFTSTNGDIFVGKLNSAGAWQWCAHATGSSADGAGTGGGGICYNTNLSRVTITASYQSTDAMFGSISVPATQGGFDLAVAELDPSTGAFLQAIGFGSTLSEDAICTYDPSTHGIFIAGAMGGSISSIPGVGALTAGGSSTDIMVVRYTPNATATNGTCTWAKSFGGTGIDRAYGVAADGFGNIIITGYFTGGTISFGGTASVTSSNTTNDIYVASLSAANGSGNWAIKAVDNGSGGADQGRGVAVAKVSPYYIYAVGQITAGSPVTFTPSSLGNTLSLTNSGSTGSTDCFIARVFGSVPLSATQSQVNLTCNGVCTGSATVVASGGTAPYTYSWSPSGGSGATASSLCATNYTCTITDAASSSITKTFTLTQPPAIAVSSVSQTNVSCFGGNTGAAVASASGGTGTLTYNWTPGNPTGDGTLSVSGLTAQNYTLTVTDANTCTATHVFNISQPSAAVSGSTVVTAVSCFGGTNGAIDLTPAGGTPGYTFDWGGGVTTEDRTGLSAGIYSVTIKDSKNCTTTVSGISVGQPSAAVSGSTVVTNATCNGGTNGAIDLTPAGGTPGYTFDWGGGITTEDRSGLSAGTYSVTIKDSKNCAATVSNISVGQGTALTGSISGTTTIPATTSATLTLTVTGTGTLSGTLSDGTLFSGTAPTITVTVTPASTTTYTISSMSNGTCTASAGNLTGSATVTVGPPPTNALAFDGIDDYVDVANSTTLNSYTTTGALTVEYWIKPVIASGNQDIISKRPGANNAGFVMEAEANTTTTDFFINTSGGWQLVTATLTANSWQHVAITAQAGGTLVFYVNGVPQATASLAGQTFTATTTGVRLMANTATGLGLRQAGGTMDEVRIWNRALCQAEIQNNMNGTLPAGQTGLSAYYTMDQGVPSGNNTAITTLTDASGNSNTGVLNNIARTGGTSNFVASTVATGTASAFQAPIAPATNTTTQTISGSTDFAAYCAVIANVTPSGAAQISGSVTAKVTIDPSVQSYNGHAYLQRHYDITPATNANNATATVTVYYTQAELDAYNAANGTDPDLPTGPSDNTGIANFFINQYHGTSSTSLPGSYSGGTGTTNVLIHPYSVTWNSARSRWEVSFPVTGFSGFFATGYAIAPLALGLKEFTAENVAGNRNRISWVTANELEGTTFDVTRSTNGMQFSTIGSVKGAGHAAQYEYIDAQPLTPVNYYRLTATEASGTVSYSNVAVVHNQRSGGSVVIAPIPATHSITITSNDASLTGRQLAIYDMQGRQVYSFTMAASQVIDISQWAAGIYQLRLPAGEVVRLVKE